MKIIHIRLLASKPSWIVFLLIAGILVGMWFKNITTIIGLGIILFHETMFGVVSGETKNSP